MMGLLQGKAIIVTGASTGIGRASAVGLAAQGANAQRLAKHLSGLRGAAMKLGQLLSLDFGAIWEGFHADSAVTVVVGGVAMNEGRRGHPGRRRRP